MATQRVIVTGGTGKAGRWIIKHLVERGYGVVNIDTRLPEQPVCANELFEPEYLPVEEAHPQRPEDTYGLSKVVGEVTAAMFRRYLPGVTDVRAELNGRTALISNRRAKELLGWKQQYFLS